MAFPGPQRTWFGLTNVVLELEQRDVEQAHLAGLVFTSNDPAARKMELPSGPTLEITIENGQGREEFGVARPEQQNPRLSVDHVVLRTSDADACIELYRDRLGIRLALDQTVPEWGGRMLFFRVGKLNLEILASDEHKGPDMLWGIAFQCPDIDAESRRLAAAGVELSSIRDGRKPGTRVATIRSHHMNIPTLLVEPAGSPPRSP